MDSAEGSIAPPPSDVSVDLSGIDGRRCLPTETPCGTECVNIATNPSHCGRCGNICTFANALAECSRGVCTMGPCAGRFADCDLNAANGCEINIDTNAMHCSGCGVMCSTVGGTPTCARGMCSTTVCMSGRGNCNGMASDGCEVDLNTSVSNCGTCGNACSFLRAAAACVAGRCVLGACDAGFADCDANPANGCEADLRSPATCGRCGNACPSGQVCDAGACTLRCPTGLTDCGGVCAARDRDPRNCGTCGNVCAFANASASCALSTCMLGACNVGFGNCDGSAANGCETNTRTVSNCGRCGEVCGNQNATPACLGSGMCDITCNTGFFDCNSDAGDGCEVNGRTLTNCGACGRTCAPANATGACPTGACGVGSCNANFANCDGSVANGCETDLRTSFVNCGACGQACMTPTGTTTNTCVAGVCAPVCAAGFGNCDGNPRNGCETDLRSSFTHCGACGNVCATPSGTTSNVCAAGVCVPSCAANRGNCDSNGANGCEADLTTSATCGACGTMCTAMQACANMGGTYACTSTCGASGLVCCPGNTCNGGLTCSVHAGTTRCCGTGRTNCSGACVDSAVDASNCGFCGLVCARPVGTTFNTCVSGMCIPSCAATYGNCDGNGVNGCETDLRTSAANCGACGASCLTNIGTSSNACASAACSPVCVESYGDCDTSRANGCEARLNTDARCGGCGVACTASATTCRPSGMSYTCQPCGGAGQPCCATGTPCMGALTCMTSVCV
ncbi:MAG: hypothetical protein HY909_01880 [Deltaproteobacteria bacterium]|nr:hypothetical protein [Deltaproteobacteria bacterium]